MRNPRHDSVDTGFRRYDEGLRYIAVVSSSGERSPRRNPVDTGFRRYDEGLRYIAVVSSSGEAPSPQPCGYRLSPV